MSLRRKITQNRPLMLKWTEELQEMEAGIPPDCLAAWKAMAAEAQRNRRFNVEAMDIMEAHPPTG